MADPLRVLSLSTVFPNVRQPIAGLFIRSRLEHLAEVADLKVVAPISRSAAWRGARGSSQPVPRQTELGRLKVFHPRWTYLPGTGVLIPFLLFLQLLPYLRRLRTGFPFQILDAHFAYPEGIAAWLLARSMNVPFVVTLRGCELLHGRYPLRRLAMSWALRRASCIIAVSEELRRYAVELGADASRTRTIPNGVDTQRFRRRDRTECRRKHGLPVEGPIVLSAGHLIELKGHHHVIDAMARLRQRGISATLLIAGGAPGRGLNSYSEELRRKVTALGLGEAVRFLGPVDPDGLAELLSAADVFCLASSREGWPNVVHEALACGTPVVATRVGAVPELIPSADHGLTVPPNDAAALADALLSALSVEWNRESIAAWGGARSWRQVAGEVLEQFRQVIQKASDCTR